MAPRGISETCSKCGRPFMGSDAREVPPVCPDCKRKVAEPAGPAQKTMEQALGELLFKAQEYGKKALIAKQKWETTLKQAQKGEANLLDLFLAHAAYQEAVANELRAGLSLISFQVQYSVSDFDVFRAEVQNYIKNEKTKRIIIPGS